MKDKLRLLIAQTCSGNTHHANIATLERLSAEASENQCDMLCLPEVSGLLNQHAVEEKLIKPDHDDPYVAACRELAARHGLWIHNGSTPVYGEKELPVNRSHLVNSSGDIVARYDKIHLFDVYLPDGKERLESKRYAAGDHAVVADSPWGPLGLTICYDLRFPRLYTELAKQGARLMFVPSAFNRRTGAAHWEVLLRSRAIENGCFIVAAAQTGQHDDGRKTYGHSMVVHPWGEVVDDFKTDVQTRIVEIDLGESDACRRQIPSLEHLRVFS